MSRNYYGLYKVVGPWKFWAAFIFIILVCGLFIAMPSAAFVSWDFWKDLFGNVFNFVSQNILLTILVVNFAVGLIVLIVFRVNLYKKDNEYFSITGRIQKYTPDRHMEEVSVRRKLFFLNLLLNIILFVCPLFVILWLIIWKSYVAGYFKSQYFIELKEKIDNNTKEWNKLNEHVNDLRNSFEEKVKKYHGTSVYEDKSLFNFSRKYLNEHTKDPFVYSCSLQVMRNSCNKPFWYLCKYFNFDKDEETLNMVEKAMNDYASAEQGKEILLDERDHLLSEIYFEVPILIRRYKKLLLFENLGFDLFDKDAEYYPVFVFDYVSAGGNSHQSNSIILDVEGMEEFAEWLDGEVKFKKSVKAQRSLMTQKLREKIKKRDNYTCKICGNSTHKEPNLLLEIDHILPISKGGITCEDNLQTLCWRCNRAKGSKVN